MVKSVVIFFIAVIFTLIPCDGRAAETPIGYSGISGAAETEQASYEPVFAETAVGDAGSFVLRNPSFQELKEFILGDTTSRKEFVKSVYECRHFATEVNNNAEVRGIRCAIALICFEEGQHAVVAFETSDRGLVYIEPQTNAVIRPKVGGTYQGDDIKEILIAW
ncbi:MAG: hypothetical protein GX631_06510 [Dehalococcoidales bacterium]|nr:hypothetical protein [Dehalococcoidales bacterium]